MIEYDEHGYYTDENGHTELNPFHPEHLEKKEYTYLRTTWARSHPEEMGVVAPPAT